MPLTFKDDDGDIVAVPAHAPILFVELKPERHDRRGGYCVQATVGQWGAEITLHYDTIERAEEAFGRLETLLTNGAH